MSHPDDQHLVKKCYDLKQQLDSGLAWINTHLPPEKQYSIRDNLRRYHRMADRYQRAAILRPSAAIFGLSQVGKSYLVSNLVRKPGQTELEVLGPPMSPEQLSIALQRPGADKIDFICDINPPGKGKESTGCVTRFTIQSNKQLGQKYYPIRLFSQSEIVKIMANGYLADLKEYQFSVIGERDNLFNRFKELADRKSPQPFPGFSENDVYDLRDYLEGTFKDHLFIRDLSNLRFWDDAANLIPYLPPQDRGKLLEFLWGKQPFFNELFSRLTDGLAELDFSNEISADIDALTPNTETLIDIERVREIFDAYCNQQSARDPEWRKPKPIEVTTREGKNLTIDRCIVAALAREIVLAIPEDTADAPRRQFLRDADILDFPGARSRKKIEEATFTAEPKIESQVEVFIRGKVSYLFDIYQQSFEISSLVFCMDNAQPNVEDIQKLIHNWVIGTHGTNREEREARENRLKTLVPESDIDRLIPLLFVCTKFNLDLDVAPTDQPNNPGSHDGKWVSRLGTNFAQYMTSAILDKWTLEWNLSDGSFKNAFLLRDPSFPGGIFYGYTNGDEQFVDGQFERIKDIKESFIRHKYVRQHFRHPETAWQEAVMPGKNGGVDYIIRHLSPICNPAIKRFQIQEAIQQLTALAARELCAHFEGGDVSQKLARANLKGAKVWAKMTMMRGHFGRFLDEITLSEDVAWKIYYDMMNVGSNGKVVLADDKSVQKNAAMEEALKQHLGISDLTNLSKVQVLSMLEQRLGVPRDQVEGILVQLNINLDHIFHNAEQPRQADIFAEHLLAEWIHRANRLKNLDLLPVWGLSEEDAEIITEELIRNADRIHLKKIVADTLDSHINHFNTSQNYDIVARLAALKFNEFVNTLGWSFVAETEKQEGGIKMADSDSATLFTTKAIPVVDKHAIRVEQISPGKNRHAQWTAGLQRSFAYNVLKESNMKNKERMVAMQQLGDIIEKLDYSCP